MSEETKNTAQEEETTDTPVTEETVENEPEVVENGEAETEENPDRQKKLSSQIRKQNLRRNRKPRQKLLSSARRKKRKINLNSRSKNLQTD